MLPKYQQNLDTINEYIKEQDLIIKVKGFTPAYSTSDEKAILRFMVLASVLEYAKPAFEKFAQHFDTRDSNLESSVRLLPSTIARSREFTAWCLAAHRASRRNTWRSFCSAVPVLLQKVL